MTRAIDLQAICTAACPLQLAFSSDTAGASLVAPQDSITQPVSSTGIAIIALADTGLTASPNNGMFNDLLFRFFGQGSSGNTFTATIFGWKQLTVNSILTWSAMTLAQFTVTLGTTTAPANSIYPSGTSDLIAHQLALVIGNQNVDVSFVSPGSNLPAWGMVDMKGCPLAQINLTMVTATKGNCLVGAL